MSEMESPKLMIDVKPLIDDLDVGRGEKDKRSKLILNGSKG